MSYHDLSEGIYVAADLVLERTFNRSASRGLTFNMPRYLLDLSP